MNEIVNNCHKSKGYIKTKNRYRKPKVSDKRRSQIFKTQIPVTTIFKS